MIEEQTSGIAPHQYENRLVCFMDLLGFKNKVLQAQNDPAVFDDLYRSIESVQTAGLRDAIYGSIPYISPKGKVMQVADDPKALADAQTNWPLSVTQFSDSFVISCPADNKISCGLLLQLVFGLYRLFFKELGIFVRGAIDMGLLVHVENGPLFGPAMNQAYYLESEVAVYPRLLFSDAAYNHLTITDLSNSYINAIFTDKDGRRSANLITMILEAPSPEDYGKEELDAKLRTIDGETDPEDLRIKTKIAYLRSALEIRMS